MALNLYWTRTAKEQLERIHAFYSLRTGPDTADELVSDVITFTEDNIGDAAAGVQLKDVSMHGERFNSIRKDDLEVVYRQSGNGSFIVYAIWKPELL
jgi:plasmid stabilization system protein ParE